MKKEIRVYVCNRYTTQLKQPPGTFKTADWFKGVSDKRIITDCELTGNIYTLETYARAVNNESSDVQDSFIRFIEVEI